MKSEYPKISLWGDLFLAIILAALGYYFFGVFGALAGLMLGVIFTLGTEWL